MRKTNKWGKAVLQLLCIACLSLALVACGGGNSSQTPPATATPTLTVSQRVLGMNLGDEATLHAALKDSNEQLVWSSSDADVVSVDGQGKLTAKKAGTATVTVTAGELTDSCVVTVTVGVIPALDAGGNVEMLAGKTYRMAPVVTYNGNPVADAPEFTFASADDAIATVGEDGTITGVAMGETEISVFAEYRYSKLYASAIVTVKEDIVLTLNESVLQLHTLAYGSAVSQGEIVPTLKVNGNVQDGSAIRWSVSGDAVTVQNGTVNAVKAGTATVTSLKSIFVTLPIIRTPTYTSAAAVAHVGIRNAIGERNIATKKQIATIRDVRPVLPPSATPADDSTNVVTVEVPQTAPTTVAVASAKRAFFISGSLPFSSSISAF